VLKTQQIINEDAEECIQRIYSSSSNIDNSSNIDTSTCASTGCVELSVCLTNTDRPSWPRKTSQ
jgi:hypothetical protein